jgi:hypothetical protein
MMVRVNKMFVPPRLLYGDDFGILSPTLYKRNTFLLIFFSPPFLSPVSLLIPCLFALIAVHSEQLCHDSPENKLHNLRS